MFIQTTIEPAECRQIFIRITHLKNLTRGQFGSEVCFQTPLCFVIFPINRHKFFSVLLT